MGKVNDGVLKNWNDGDIVDAATYKQERELLRLASNDTHEKQQGTRQIVDEHTGQIADLEAADVSLESRTTDLEENKADKSNVYNRNETYARGEIDLLELTPSEKTFTASEGQTVFSIADTDSTYSVGENRMKVWVGGVPQSIGPGKAVEETNETTITLSEGVPAGTTVLLRWLAGVIPYQVSVEHSGRHYEGGPDPLDITKLPGFQSEVAAPLAETMTNGNGMKSRVIFGVIRNLGDGNGFQLITDGGHTPFNISSIETLSDRIRVNYSFTGTSTGTFLANPDEQLAQKGFFMGSSVASSYADIFLRKTDNVSGYISKSGGVAPTYSVSNGKGIVSVENSGLTGLIVNHEKCYNYSGISVITRSPSIRCYVNSMDSSGQKTFLKFCDHTGTEVNPPDGTVILFNRVGGGDVLPSDVSYPSSNIWLFGVMKI
jgi:hypothetical protein